MSTTRFVLFIGLILLISACNPQEESNQRTANFESGIIHDFINQPGLENASIGIFVVDLMSDEIVFEYNSKTSLVPASTLKILTSAAALETFGSDHTFKTTLAYSGKISEGRTLNKNLILMGGGDPVFLSPLFEDHYDNTINEMVQEVQSSGIRWINGNVVGDGSYFGSPQIPDTWIWEDIGNYYGAPAYGLNIYDNTYEVIFETKESGTKAKLKNISPVLPWLKFESKVIAAENNRDNAYIYGSNLSKNRLITGTIPQNRKSFMIKGSIPDPAIVAARQLLSGLKESGIGLSGEAASNYSEGKHTRLHKLLEIESPPLSDIIFQLNIKSINLYAEALLLHLAKKESKNCSIEDGCKALTRFWENTGMNTSGLHLEDGSGLSRANAISAEQLVFVLKHMHKNGKQSESFIRSLPQAGFSGSLKSFGKGTNLEGNLKAKSGYISRVLNYTGYLASESGQELAIAVMVNNYNCSNSEMKKMLEEFFVSVVNKTGNP